MAFVRLRVETAIGGVLHVRAGIHAVHSQPGDAGDMVGVANAEGMQGQVPSGRPNGTDDRIDAVWTGQSGHQSTDGDALESGFPVLARRRPEYPRPAPPRRGAGRLGADC